MMGPQGSLQKALGLVGKEGEEENMNTDMTLGLGMVRARHLHDSYLEGSIPNVWWGWTGQVRPGLRVFKISMQTFTFDVIGYVF